MDLKLSLNLRQIALINYFQMCSFSEPLHVLQIGTHIYIHLWMPPSPRRDIFKPAKDSTPAKDVRTEKDSRPTSTRFEVQVVTKDEASIKFECCESLRGAMSLRCNGLTDDTMLFGSYIEHSGSRGYTAVGDERELEDIAKDGGGQWVISLLHNPASRIEVPEIPFRGKNDIITSALASGYTPSLPGLSCRTLLRNSVHPLEDPHFSSSDSKLLGGSILCHVTIPLNPAKPFELALEKRFIALARDLYGMDDIGMCAVYLTSFSYGNLISYDPYHEAIRHCRNTLTYTLPQYARHWCSEVAPEHRWRFQILAKLGADVIVRGHNKVEKGRLIGILGSFTHGLINDARDEDVAWVVDMRRVIL